MKNYLRIALGCGLLALVSFSSKAQYYQIANQLPGLIQPALSGSLNYKGYVDVSYLKGLGYNSVDFLNVSTSQGFKYSSWFYMGVGVGVDVAFSNPANDNEWIINSFSSKKIGKTGVMVPVFTDFRFNIGNISKPAFYADIRLGASFLLTDDYLGVGNGYISNREYFYLKPSLGVRVPLNKNSGKQAIDIGVTYQLLTTNYWYNSPSNLTLSALGATVAFEW